MKIVVLDGYTMNPGDLSWETLQSLGDCTLHDRTAPEEVAERCAGAEALITNKVVLSGELIRSLPNLKYIGVTATGFNVVDLEAARGHRIPVTNVPAYSTDSVVQMVFALLLQLTQQVSLHNQQVQEGAWANCSDFSFTVAPLAELSGKTLGLVGYGNIGRRVADVGRAFGMQVLVQTRSPEKYTNEPVVLTDLDNLFAESDVVSLHCPLTAETENLVDEERLMQMKPTAYLINTGRGPLLDEAAVADALNSDRLAGVGVDVLSAEPPRDSSPLIGAKNCLVTPHIAWATLEARQRLMRVAVDNVRAFQAGREQNVVN